MKKSLFTTMVILMALMAFQFQAKAGATLSLSAGDEAIVNFDESEIYSSFDQVSDLVSYVSENEAVTYSDVASVNNELVENVSSSAAVALSNSSQDSPPLISAFWWGCLTGPIGIVVVAVTTGSDKEQIKKSAIGCAIPAGIAILYYVIVIVIVGASVASVSTLP
jgi:hypothetical protein